MKPAKFGLWAAVLAFAGISNHARAEGWGAPASCGAKVDVGSPAQGSECQVGGSGQASRSLTDRSVNFRKSAPKESLQSADAFESGMLEMVREFAQLAPSVWPMRGGSGHAEAVSRAEQLISKGLANDFDEVFLAEGAGMTWVDTKKEKPSIQNEEKKLKQLVQRLRLRARALGLAEPKPERDSAEQNLVRGQKAWARARDAAQKLAQTQKRDAQKVSLRLTQWHVRRLEAMLREFPRKTQ